MMSDMEKRVLTEVQRLPLVPEPFKEVANRLDLTEEEVLDTCRSLLERGMIRRFGPSIAHRKFGYKANPMCLLKVPEERIDEVGRLIAEDPSVSHCYYREGWDFNIFFMVHGQTKEEATQKATDIISRTGIGDHDLRFSLRELKKTSFELP